MSGSGLICFFAGVPKKHHAVFVCWGGQCAGAKQQLHEHNELHPAAGKAIKQGRTQHQQKHSVPPILINIRVLLMISGLTFRIGIY